MPVLKIFIHFIWSTKNRAPYLIRPDIREQTWDHIRINAKLKNISLLGVSGHSDHCHCLFSMGNDQMISKIIQLIKGESSYWINKSGLILNDFGKDKFDWQDDYFGETVSPHLIPSVINYLSIQEEHHKKISFKDEYNKFLSEYNEGNFPY